MLIFTDAATCHKSETAIGVFLFLERVFFDKCANYTNEELFKIISEKIIYKKYSSKKSTWAEIRTAIDALIALENTAATNFDVEVYTDCQSLFDLLTRRKEKLEQNHFITRTGKILANAELYKELFAMTNKFRIKIIKMKGHVSASLELTLAQKIFGILDKASRKKLRDAM